MLIGCLFAFGYCAGAEWTGKTRIRTLSDDCRTAAKLDIAHGIQAAVRIEPI